MGRLQGKGILVTGATGIAAAAAVRARTEGAELFVISRTADHARGLADRVGGGWAVADLAVTRAADDAVGAAVAHLGRIDGLLAVAGGSGRKFGDGPIHAVSDDGWDRTLDLNLRSQAVTARAVTRVMLAQDRTGDAPGSRGSIVLVSSVLATRPVPDLFETHAYAAAKGAILSLATTMAATYARRGIRVNVLAPSLTATPMAQRAADDPEIVAFARRKQPLVNGFLSGDDVAHGAIYLLADESRAVTGQVLAIDGGWSVTAVTPDPTQAGHLDPESEVHDA